MEDARGGTAFNTMQLLPVSISRNSDAYCLPTISYLTCQLERRCVSMTAFLPTANLYRTALEIQTHRESAAHPFWFRRLFECRRLRWETSQSASTNSSLRNSVSDLSVSPTPHHPKPGLGSHSRCVKVGLGNNQARPLTQIHSQTLFQECGSNFGPGQRGLHSPIQSRDTDGKEWHGNGSGRIGGFASILIQFQVHTPLRSWCGTLPSKTEGSVPASPAEIPGPVPYLGRLKNPQLCQGPGPLKASHLYRTGIDLRLVSRRRVVTADNSNTG